MSSFTEVFGGTTIYPSDVTYLALALTGNTTLEWPLDAPAGETLVARIIDITPTGAYTITMPDATEASTGEIVLFNNLGPDTVTVVKNGGGALLTLAAGEQWEAYIYDNTTAAGSWRTFRFGASTAQAQASALQGPGIVAIGSTLAQEMDISTINSTPYTFLTTDRAGGFVWTGALGTFNLPASATAGQGWFVNVRNSGTGNLTIDPSGAETINGTATLTMTPGDSAVIATDGTSWYTIGLGKNAVFAFDYTTISLAGLSGTYTLSGAELNRIAYNFTGALAGNIVVIVPPTVQQYWINNAATGFTLGVRVSGSAVTVNITSGERGIYYSNGTDMLQAVTVAGISLPLTVAEGGTNATSAAGARTNLGAAASGANSDITALQGLSASQVAVTFSGDGNTGYGTAGADTLSGGVGGNRAYYIDNVSNGNLAFGSTALDSITSGNDNTGVGYGAGTAVTTGTQNVALGNTAGDAITTGSRNTALGYAALTSLTTGVDNTALGNGAGSNATGDQNTFLGRATSIGTALSGSNNTIIGYAAIPSGVAVSNEFTLGNSAISVLRCQVTSITALSDERDKAHIRLLPEGMDLVFINALLPRIWTWDMRDGAKVGVPGIGFVAQELQAAQDDTGVYIPGLVYDENPDKLEAAPGVLMPVLVRAVQQLSAMVDAQAAKITELETKLG